MQKNFYILTLFIIFSIVPTAFIAGQEVSPKPVIPKEMPPGPYGILKQYVKEQNNYITPILELQEMEEEYLASPLKGIYLEYMTYLLGSVGNFDEMYRYEERFLSSLPIIENQRKRNSENITVSPLKDHKEIDAVQAIEKVAEKEQVIMINEEHRTPHHRAFTTQILQPLYKKGFRYLAIEALYSADTELNKRGYPTQSTGSINTSDPVFGDMIRTALKIGYKVVPYEREEKCVRSPEKPFECDDKREKEQAQNIYERILKNDPKAKILVHAGRDHIAKAETPELSMMAKHFEKLTKITPFSIDQMRLSERFNPADEIPLYRFISQKDQLKNPMVFQNKNGDFYGKSESHDMFIFHPKAKYENGRPNWLKMNGKRTAAKIDLKKLKIDSKNDKFAQTEPVLIQALYSNESADAIPIDQIMLYPDKKIPVLILPKGNFKIRAMNRSGKILGEYSINENGNS